MRGCIRCHGVCDHEGRCYFCDRQDALAELEEEIDKLIALPEAEDKPEIVSGPAGTIRHT